MKTRNIFLMALLALFISVPVFIFANSETDIVTVEKVNRMFDGVEVKLQGNIVMQLDGESYLFKDETGEIKIEVDDDVICDRDLISDRVFVIHGEVVKDDNVAYIEVDKITYDFEAGTNDMQNGGMNGDEVEEDQAEDMEEETEGMNGAEGEMNN